MIVWLTYGVLVFWLGSATLALVNLLTVVPLEEASPPSDGGPLVSVVIPARNEERSIRATLASMLTQTWENLDIVVVDDQSEDSTGAIATELAASDERVRLVSGTDHPEGWLGKPWALEQGGREAKGEWILFVDADVAYEPSAIASLMAEAESNPEFAMHFVMPRVIAEGFWENVLMPGLACALYLTVPIRLVNRSRSIPFAVGGGTGNLVRAEAWRAIGGHERLRNAVVDDIGLARMLRRFGFRTRLVQGDDHVSIRMYHGLGEIVRGFTKNAYSLFAGSVWQAVLSATLMATVHLAPWVVAIGGLAGVFERGALVAALATLGTIMASRLALYRTFGFSLLAAALLQPLEIGLFLFIFARSTLVVGILGRATWRGREYPARVTTFGEWP